MALPQARHIFGGGWGFDVRTEGELEDALEKAAAEDGLVFIGFTPGGWNCPEALRSAGRSMAKNKPTRLVRRAIQRNPN